MMLLGRVAAGATMLLLTLGGCTAGETDTGPAADTDPSPSEEAASKDSGERDPLPAGVSEPPDWLGRRPLPIGPNGFGIARSTPKRLRDRRLATRDFLAAPSSARFSYAIESMTKDVLARSTYAGSCPVDRDDLVYVTMSFWGFDRRPHTGEMLLHRSVARDVVGVFRALYRRRWPMEEMRITSKDELDAAPTGDGNNTSAFVCRAARGSARWSQHAYGLAVDINPFHNPYVNDDVTLPERAIAYRNRRWRRPGMIFEGDVVTRSFAQIGWGWGGDWTSAKDWMHFSSSGR